MRTHLGTKMKLTDDAAAVHPFHALAVELVKWCITLLAWGDVLNVVR